MVDTEQTEAGEARRRPPDIAQLLGDHSGVLVGATAVGYLALILVRVSRGSTTTALAVLQSAGTVEVAVGVAVIGFPLMVLAATVAIINSLRTGVLGRRWYSVAYFLTVTLVPIPLLVVGAGVLLLLEIGRYVRRRWIASIEAIEGWTVALTLTALLVGLSLMAPSRPWMPPEIWTLHDGTSVVVYRLSDDSRTVLVDSNREVITLDDDTVVSRSLCTLPGDLQSYSSLFQILDHLLTGQDGPTYPSCRSERSR